MMFYFKAHYNALWTLGLNFDCTLGNYPVCNHGSISTEVLHNNTCSYMCMPFTYSRINRGIWTIECNLGVIGWSYSWQNAIWWSLIRLSRYPQSSLETFLTKVCPWFPAIVESCTSGVHCWAPSDLLQAVEIWLESTSGQLRQNWFRLVTWLTAYRVITKHVHGAP